jgi:hypothetical protein
MAEAMKTTKKSRPSAKRKPGRPVNPATVERQVIGARLHPDIYKKLVDAAAANRNSISIEVERRIEHSFEPNATNPDSELHALAVHIVTAFEAGARLAITNREQPPKDWLKDSEAFNRGVIRAVEAMMDKHPAPRWADFLLLIVAIRDRLAAIWMKTEKLEFEEGRPLPDVNQMDEAWRGPHPPPDKAGKDEG